MKAVSVHRRIHDEIAGRITSGALKPGERLPSEGELMAAYDCSRMTVYKALAQLQAAGLIERRRKAGSFVCVPKVSAMVLEIPDLQAQAEAKGFSYAFRLVSRQVRGEDLELTGVHVRQGKPLCFEHRVIHLEAVPDAADVDFAKVSPGHWLLEHVAWNQAQSQILAMAADTQVAEMLELAKGAPCLKVSRQTWRGTMVVTEVQQVFDGTQYQLVATF